MELTLPGERVLKGKMIEPSESNPLKTQPSGVEDRPTSSLSRADEDASQGSGTSPGPASPPTDNASSGPLPISAASGLPSTELPAGQLALSECSDGDLAAMVAQGGDGGQAAATELIGRYQAPVRSFLRRLCGKDALADDLAQDTFVRLLKHADRFDPRYPMRRWLFTIARRLLINHVRKSDQKVGATEYLGMESKENQPAEIASRDDQLRFTRRLLDAAIHKLNETQREVLVLFHQKEMSIQDVAEMLEMPTGTVKSHLHRARAALRKILEPQLEAIEP